MTSPPRLPFVVWLRRVAEPVSGVAAVNLWLPSLFFATAAYFPLARLIVEPFAGPPAPPPAGAFAFTRMVWKPEPLEIPIYVAGYFVIPLLAAALFFLLRVLSARRALIYRLVLHWPISVGAVLAASLIFKLGLHVFDFAAWQQFLPKGEAKQQLLLLAALGAGGLAYWRRFDLVAWWRKLEMVDWWRWRFPFFAVVTLLMFNPNFTYDHHHYGYTLGIINGLRHGRWLLVDLAGYYGIGNYLTLLGIVVFTGMMSFTALNLILQLISIAAVITWVYLMRRVTGSALVSYLVALAIVLFPGLPVLPLDANLNPINGAFRHVFFLLVTWVWVNASKDFRVPVAIALALSAVGFFWMTDTGLYLAAATWATVAFCAARPGVRTRQWIFRAGKAAVALAAGIMLAAAGYSLAAWQTMGRFPDWSQYFAPMIAFGKGYQLYPLPWWGFFQMYVAVFLATLLALGWRRWVSGRTARGDTVMFFITTYSALQLLYYIARSYSLNLSVRHTALLALIAGWWYAQYFRSPRPVDPIVSRGASALAVTLAVFAAALVPFKLGATLQFRDYANFPASFTAETIGRPEVYGGDREVLDDIAALSRDYAPGGRIALFAPWDAKILLDLDLANVVPVYEFTAPLTEAEVDPAIAAVRTERPGRLFIGRTDSPIFKIGFLIYQDRIDYFWRGVKDLYELERQLKTLTVYRLKS